MVGAILSKTAQLEVMERLEALWQLALTNSGRMVEVQGCKGEGCCIKGCCDCDVTEQAAGMGGMV